MRDTAEDHGRKFLLFSQSAQIHVDPSPSLHSGVYLV